MAGRGHGLRRWLRGGTLFVLPALVLGMASTPAVAAPKSWTEGEAGSGAPAFPSRTTRVQLRIPTAGWSDLADDDRWAKTAVDWVAGIWDWMRDVPPDRNGEWRFKPDAPESRIRWARAMVRAFAVDAVADPSITFTDLDPDDRETRYAAIAVEHGWMTKAAAGRFDPGGFVTARGVHRSLVFALGMRSTARALDHLATTDGYRFDTPKLFGVNLLAMRLGLRFNNKSDESQDVTPTDTLVRKQVAWSLYRATTLEEWVVPYLEEQYAGMVLPKMSAGRRSIVDWGVRYIAYPYIWGGEWGFENQEPSALGVQPGPGFDCSGLTWWAVRRDDGGVWEISPPRPHEGWPLAQRTSAWMASMTKEKLVYADLKPGDLLFYDGDRDGTVDHVDVFVGNGWALDSSSSVGGVTLMWVETGWYRDHFVHGRRVLPTH